MSVGTTHAESVARRSTIMDGNSYRPLDEAAAPPLVARRQRLLSPTYRLFYHEPVHAVRASGARIWDADGVEYLDMYNNVASIGHAHPRVVEAVHDQMQMINTHTRYLHEAVVDYAEAFLGTMPEEIDRAMFVCTGSEANDLALRIAEHATGNRGVIVTAEAYHGNTGLTSDISPALGSGSPLGAHVRVIPAPDRYRVRTDDLAAWFAARMQEAIDDLSDAGFGVSSFVADTLFSSDGVHPAAPGDLVPAVEALRRAGGVLIADEVQPGFARTGSHFWGFQRHGLVPDLVTTGKPMGNGIPIAGVAARATVLEPFALAVPYFNTFGGNPVSIAAASAVLQVIGEERMQESNARTGAALLAGLRELAGRHDAVGDVRGAGLYVGVELVADGDAPDGPRGLAVVNALRERRVLTSVAGPHSNVLKIRPPYAFGAGDIPRFLEALDGALTATRA